MGDVIPFPERPRRAPLDERAEMRETAEVLEWGLRYWPEYLETHSLDEAQRREIEEKIRWIREQLALYRAALAEARRFDAWSASQLGGWAASRESWDELEQG